MCVCVQTYALCYHVWDAGSPPRNEAVGDIFNWPPCESYVPFPFHLFAVINLIQCLKCRFPSRRWRCRWGDFPRWPSVSPLWRHRVPNANGSDLHLPGAVSKRHWQPPDGARRHQTGGCLWAAQGRSVQVHVLCHRVQRQHTESSGVLSGHGDQHAGQCTLPLAGQV